MTRPVPGTDSPEILAEQRRQKHEHRKGYAFDPDSLRPATAQHDAAIQRLLLHAALVKAWGRKVADAVVREWEGR